MAASAFACFRGSPMVMAADLGRAAHSGLEVQLCGDAHRLNFGFYASTERGPSRGISSGWSAAWRNRLARHGARADRKEMQALANPPRMEVW